MVLTVVFAVVAVVAVAIAAYAWWHAAKWGNLIAYGRVVVEYKGKVKIDAPLQEWALWCEQTRKDKAQPERMRGHVMYVMGGTRIAVFAGKRPPKVKPLKSRREHVIQQAKDAAKKSRRSPRTADGSPRANGTERGESTDRQSRGVSGGAR